MENQHKEANVLCKMVLPTGYLITQPIFDKLITLLRFNVHTEVDSKRNPSLEHLFGYRTVIHKCTHGAISIPLYHIIK
jgi:hypothetical protein